MKNPISGVTSVGKEWKEFKWKVYFETGYVRVFTIENNL